MAISDEPRPSMKVVPTIYPTSTPIDESLHHFWDVGAAFHEVDVRIEAPVTPLAILEQLGPSPFERSRFPLIGFLATTYEKATRFALDQHRFASRSSPVP